MQSPQFFIPKITSSYRTEPVIIWQHHAHTEHPPAETIFINGAKQGKFAKNKNKTKQNKTKPKRTEM